MNNNTSHKSIRLLHSTDNVNRDRLWIITPISFKLFMIKVISIIYWEMWYCIWFSILARRIKFRNIHLVPTILALSPWVRKPVCGFVSFAESSYFISTINTGITYGNTTGCVHWLTRWTQAKPPFISDLIFIWTAIPFYVFQISMNLEPMSLKSGFSKFIVISHKWLHRSLETSLGEIQYVFVSILSYWYKNSHKCRSLT